MSIESSSVSARVVRGGSWCSVPQFAQFARVADRNGNSPGFRNSNLGLRLMRRCT